MITFEEFVEKYHPTKNLFSSDLEEIRFETYGSELNYVLRQENEFVWTAIDCSNENVYTIPGKHFVDRLHYYVCRHPWTSSEEEVNENEMISKRNAVNACLKFFNIPILSSNIEDITNYIEKIYPNKHTITIGDAKYSAIDYWESIGNEFTQEHEDSIDDYYLNLV